MQLKEALFIALHCMHKGRLRCFLTVSGIVASVALVIILAGLSGSLNATYNLAYNIVNEPISVTKALASTPGGNRPRSLSDSDVEALKRECDPSLVSGVMPIVGGAVPIRNGPAVYRANVTGATTDYLQMSVIEVTAGSVFSKEQYRNSARVVLVGPEIVSALFNGDNYAALNSSVQIGLASFKVIGTLSLDDRGGNTALMPMTTARSYLFGGMHTVSSIILLSASVDSVPAAVKQVQSILDQQHFIKDPDQRDFDVRSADYKTTATRQLLNLLVWFGSGVIGIALLIGALGLANIMLITVTERTNEIGVRRAVGARRGAILRQFLVESIILAAGGGLIGVTCGVGAILVARALLAKFALGFVPPEVSVPAVILGFGLSLVIGLVAGCYPAIRASRLHPWDALRH